MRTIESKWQLLQVVAIDARAPAIQRREMRRAFYAGASALLQILGETEGLSDAATEAIIEGLQAECLAFGISVGQGKA